MKSLPIQLQESVLRKVLKRLHYPLDVMLLCGRWYAAYALSLRNLEEMMAERCFEVDHATVHRWALKILPILAKVFRRHKRPVGRSWRMDETYIRVGGQWKYLYRTVDKLGHTVDFLLTAKRDHAAARRFFEQAIGLHDVPEKITIDKSGTNTAAVHSMVADSGVEIELRQSKYLNNLVEQDHRAVKRRTRPMLGFKDFPCTAKLIAGIETMHMIRKRQLDCPMAKSRPLPSNSTAWPSNPCTLRPRPLNFNSLMRQNPFYPAHYLDKTRSASNRLAWP